MRARSDFKPLPKTSVVAVQGRQCRLTHGTAQARLSHVPGQNVANVWLTVPETASNQGTTAGVALNFN